MINRRKLPQHFADYGITPRRIVPVHENNGIYAYSLFKIPKVDGLYLGVRQIDGDPIGRLVPKGGLEKTVSLALMDGEQPLTPKVMEKLVYLARGLHPPEPYDFADHPFPSTLDSETSGF